MPQLTATGFALLAQIAREPTSAYGLAVQMRRNLHYLWPRAESRIYSEVNRLEARGLVEGRTRSVGRRRRRVMRITGAGRRALRAWVSGPVTAGIALESEALLRIFFGALGSIDDLRRAIERTHADAGEMLGIAYEVGLAYLAGTGPAPEQAHVRAMMHELLSEYALLLRGWSSAQLELVSTWRDVDLAGKGKRARAKFATTMRQLERAGIGRTGNPRSTCAV